MSLFNTNTWAYLSIAMFIITILLIAGFTFSKIATVKKVCFFVGILTLLFSIFFFDFSRRQKNNLVERNYVIIFSPTVTRTDERRLGEECMCQ